jgi:hypothetical protein
VADKGDETPAKLSRPEALKKIREIATDSSRVIVVVGHARRQIRGPRKHQKITRRQIERCVQMGRIDEGPSLNKYGNWQVDIIEWLPARSWFAPSSSNCRRRGSR